MNCCYCLYLIYILYHIFFEKSNDFSTSTDGVTKVNPRENLNVFHFRYFKDASATTADDFIINTNTIKDFLFLGVKKLNLSRSFKHKNHFLSQPYIYIISYIFIKIKKDCWQASRDSNPDRTVLETGKLPLQQRPICFIYFLIVYIL